MSRITGASSPNLVPPKVDQPDARPPAPLAPAATQVSVRATGDAMEAPRAPNAPAAEVAAKAGGPVVDAAAVPTDVYKVAKGDTLNKIATRFHQQAKTLAADNHVKNANLISVGQPLKLRDTVLLNVAKGDTLTGLASRFGTTAAALGKANGLSADTTLSAGMQLVLPGASFHTVKAGDTLTRIAKSLGTTLPALQTANGISNANVIRVGQKLVIPGKGVAPKPKPDPLADPKVMQEHKGTKYRFLKHGKLFIDGIGSNDVQQGQAGDCYFLSALSGLAKTHPEVIQNAIKQNADGSYTATFYQIDYKPKDPKNPDGEYVPVSKPVHVKIDGDLPMSWGTYPLYAQGETKNELWAPLLEKAYAKWKGGYDAIGNGGWPDQALTDLTGKPGHSQVLQARRPANLAKFLENRLAGGGTMCASTKSDKEEKGTGIIGNHAYTVLGVTEQDGKTMVQLRNPWGMSEPGNDGKDDGVFQIPLAKFRHCFSEVEWVA
jgi:LysM repeat protein